MEADQSFVFFEEKPVGDAALGSAGTLGAALTPLASLAIDPRLNALGAPYYVDAAPVRGLLIGQDTGGAIRGAGARRCVFRFWRQGGSRGRRHESRWHACMCCCPMLLAARLGQQKDFSMKRRTSPKTKKSCSADRGNDTAAGDRQSQSRKSLRQGHSHGGSGLDGNTTGHG